ncbi:MAG TPA: stimulus-sensing domain-containing protein [Hyphomicrobiaceae bacterium]|nr:stimulus-sensing domain-containing protein [Hyphomicrobiaceae bacterium]
MPLDTGEHSPGVSLQSLRMRLSRLAPRTEAISHFLSRARSSRVYRLFTKTLARRIFVSNILGLLVLLGGILWLSQHQNWLIWAKRESLRVQGEIIAAAIAASATVDRENSGITFDPERLTEVGSARFPLRDDGFAAFELSLRPDKVGPVIRRLIQPNHNTRARIYDREGDLIVDTSQVGTWDQKAAGSGEWKRAKNFWTRLLSYVDGSDLPLYLEIGAANGRAYAEVRQALAGRLPEPMLLLNEQGKQIVSLAVPIQRRNATLGALLLSTRPGEIDSILAKERRIIIALSVMALLTTLMASALLTRTIAGPVHRLSDAAEQVSQSINTRAELPDYSGRPDEVGQLAVAVRRMTDALYRRIEAADMFAADVAHELKNPVAAVSLSAQNLRFYAKTPEQREQMISEIQSELQRLDRLITDVAEASRLEADIERQTNAPVDLAEILAEVTGVLSDVHAGEDLTIKLDIAPAAAAPGALVVYGHATRLGRVITNLVDNALSFSPPGGTVWVKAQLVGPEIEILVEDEGRGIPEDKLEDIFTRFYSDRPEKDQTVGKNSGLGLSITRLIVNGHGGRIWAENRRGARPEGGKARPNVAPASPGVIGARFVVRLPAGLRRLRGQGSFGRRT